MNSIKKSRLTIIWLAFFLLIIAMPATRVSAVQKVQLVGTIKGAGCTHYQVECYNDDNHIALEDDFL